MKIHNYPGFYVAIEGLDGSGSDKVATSLVRQLRRQKLPLVFVKEPTRGPVGVVIKKLLRRKTRPISPLMLEFLFAADRSMNEEQKIIPALKKGQLVIADRCLWSSIAYRSLELPVHWLLEVNRRFVIPNVTFLIDVPPEVCAARIKKGQDSLQLYFAQRRLDQIQEGYHWIVSKFPYWFRIIDGGQSKNQIVAEITAHLQKIPKFRKMS